MVLDLKIKKFAHISAAVRDRAKCTKFGDHICSQQNIFEYFENFKFLFFLKIKFISETVRDREKQLKLGTFLIYKTISELSTYLRND